MVNGTALLVTKYHLAGARALTVDISPNNTVYVADTEHSRILKLTYGVGYLGGEGSHAFSLQDIQLPSTYVCPLEHRDTIVLCLDEGERFEGSQVLQKEFVSLSGQLKLRASFMYC